MLNSLLIYSVNFDARSSSQFSISLSENIPCLETRINDSVVCKCIYAQAKTDNESEKLSQVQSTNTSE